MRIAVFDYKVIVNNPAGSCHRRMLEGLCAQHEFTVFAVEFENPCPERIRFVRVPAFKRPLALLFISYHLLAPICYLLYRLRGGPRFDLIQMIESNLSFGDISYAHFCHRAYLKQKWGRGANDSFAAHIARRLDHQLHAWMESWVFRRVKKIVVPSEGLARELRANYPFTDSKISLLPNPVDIERMRKPADFDRAAFRAQWKLDEEDLVIAFVALGHFDRKGLPLLLEAISKFGAPSVPLNGFKDPHPDPLPECRERGTEGEPAPQVQPESRVKLLVVGGREERLVPYRELAAKLGISDRVVFAGMQKDVRPFFWASDAFTLPSSYEVFPLVALEAAAASLPLVVTPLNGVEEFLVNGENGILVQKTADDINAGLRRLVHTDPQTRHEIGRRSAMSVLRFDTKSFIHRWETLYAC